MKIKFNNKKITPVFKDKRGSIFDILEVPVSHVGIVTFKKGAVRGNHYHKKSAQYSYILSGKIELTIKKINEKRARDRILKEGDLTTIPPNMIHTYRALENSSMLDLTTYARGIKGYETDTVRV
ncbi:MAG: Cupin 2 conserved barrel domain protein [Candidatus Giovannonibacteria bacterium GW2011_GWC2_44_8]|uniref:Cupin 2 conserved barrel domain protein n=1 Tax=Candidatus Giovannonibacteria bacterium GW2011_GWC2_44_8 TaxID=1618657 RepID=A0A0G1K0P4_9BACT|nr:MAG: Cupin 2 conserved barrel domain protein [Candidatus Giovannonibacteria bacterium GW2011_GWC2_44_8]